MQEIIETERLLLRPFVLDDAKDVFEYASDEQTVEYLTWSAHKDIAESMRIIQTIYIPTKVYCIELKEEHKCIGAFEARIFDDESSFGYILNQKYWNNGYMTEVLKAMIDIFFEDAKCRAVFGIHFLGNETSGTVMHHCGMKMIGTQKELVQAKEKIFTPVLYKLERQDWKKLQTHNSISIS